MIKIRFFMRTVETSKIDNENDKSGITVNLRQDGYPWGKFKKISAKNRDILNAKNIRN